MNRNLEAQVVQNVMRQLMRSDRNEDFKFDSKELKRLKTNLSNIPGVKFYKENFEKICSKQRQLSLKDIMAMFRNLKADIPEEESIFHLEPQKSVKTGMIF